MENYMSENFSIIPQTRLIPLTDWPKHHPWPPLGGLRHLVFTQSPMGLIE